MTLAQPWLPSANRTNLVSPWDSLTRRSPSCQGKSRSRLPMITMSGWVIFSANPSNVMSQARRSAASGDDEYERTSNAWRVSGFKSFQVAPKFTDQRVRSWRVLAGSHSRVARRRSRRVKAPHADTARVNFGHRLEIRNHRLPNDFPLGSNGKCQFGLALPGSIKCEGRHTSIVEGAFDFSKLIFRGVEPGDQEHRRVWPVAVRASEESDERRALKGDYVTTPGGQRRAVLRD